MILAPPIEQYLSGNNPTHSSRQKLSNHIDIPQYKIEHLLIKHGILTSELKLTKTSKTSGLIDQCEGRVLWNVKNCKNFIEAKLGENPSKNRSEPAWVDLGVVGTYFGVSNIVIGRWLDQLGFRALPTIEKNDSGDYDMLDMSNQAKEKQANGFIGKQPTEKAFNFGLARTITVTNRKQKEVDITQWNLDLCKEVLIRAGHELDHEHKMALKGKGKNSNVTVNGIDKRAKELYTEWAKLYSNPDDRWKAKKVFAGQPTMMLEKVEKLMGLPGYLTTGKYLKE